MSFNFNLLDPFVDSKPNLGTFTLSGEVFDTPCLVVSGYVGGLQYTTPDCLAADLNDGNKHISQLEISDLARKDFGDMPLSTLRNGKQACILSSRNVIYNVATTDSTGINIDSFNGRIHIGVSEYAKRITLDKPSAIIAFADEVNITSGRKRLGKAVERSMTWFNELIASSAWKDSSKPFLFGVVVPVPEVAGHVSQSSNSLLSKGAQGLVVGCSHLGESEEVRLSIVREVRSAAGDKAPVMIQGADSLRQILLSLSLGVDLISTNFPSLITARGMGICWGHKRQHIVSSEDSCKGAEPLNHKKKRSVFDLVADENDEEQEETERGVAPKRVKQESINNATEQGEEAGGSATATVSASSGTSHPKRPKHIQKPPPASDRPTSNQHRPIERCSEEEQARFEQNLLLLWDKQYERDATPMMADCKCHACKFHTKAYIHHLLTAKEMLAEVLLYHHNAYQLNHLMRTAREKRNQGLDVFDKWFEETLNTL